MAIELRPYISSPSLELFQEEIRLAIYEKAWIERSIEEIGQERLFELLSAAGDVRKNAYAPYSNYKVGAAILTEKGKIYTGVNNEFATYAETGHAEGNAIAKAISEGAINENRTFIRALAVVHEGGSESGPCGRCSQCIKEHANNTLIIISDAKLEKPWATSLTQLFPNAFGPSDLGLK